METSIAPALSSLGGRPRAFRGTRRGAFTLIEVLTVVAIVAVLLSLLLPAAQGMLRAARAFRCQMSQRSVAFDFSVFADETLHGDRGNDARLGDRFFLETFQDSQYCIDEFWCWGDQPEARMPDARGNDPMRCSEVRGEITLRRDTPCTQGAINPPQLISYGFNLRLHRPEVRDAQGRLRMSVPVPLTSAVLQEQMVPLFWDVDGQVAFDRGHSPVFSAPAAGSDGPLANDFFWFPAYRHGGVANFAFIDGHVEASKAPLEEPGWRWTYQTVR